MCIDRQIIYAERRILGAFLIEPRIFSACFKFQYGPHKDVYNAMERLHRNGEAIDIITLTQALKQDETYERCGGAYTLTEIMDT